MNNKSTFFTDTRITGLFYLGLAFTGMFAFLFAKSKLFVDGNAIATHTNLLEREALAHIGIAAELALVAFQCLAAVWFYKLFQKVNNFAAGLIAAFGMVNATTILISNALWLGALNAARSGELVTTVYTPS